MLITKSDILTYRDISKSVRDDKINPYIKDAERLDLRPLLGERLYRDMIANTTSQIYIDILDAKDYNDDNGEPRGHGGLKEILSLYAWSRYVMFGSFTDTSFGHVKKKTQDSEPLSYQEKKSIYTQDTQTALTLWGDVERYLNINSETYPLWKSGSCSQRTNRTFNISKISR